MVPNKNLKTPISAIAGIPAEKMYTVMVNTAAIDTHANVRKMALANFSTPCVERESTAQNQPRYQNINKRNHITNCNVTNV